jgi:hypothetical protein
VDGGVQRVEYFARISEQGPRVECGKATMQTCDKRFRAVCDWLLSFCNGFSREKRGGWLLLPCRPATAFFGTMFLILPYLPRLEDRAIDVCNNAIH